MIQRIPLLILILFLWACEPAENELSTEDRDKITQLIDNQSDAWNRGDLDAFMDGYWQNDALRFAGKSGVTYGWETVLSNYKRGFPNREDMGHLIFDIDSIHRPNPPYVTVDGQWTIHRQDTIGGRFILLFDRPDGQTWKIVEDHTW